MKVLTVFGTRPEAIKMAPLIKHLAASDIITSLTCSTGQHREMVQQVVDLFGLTIDYDLAVMTPGQTLTDVTTNILVKLGLLLERERPDWVLVHGDTTTALAAALSAFYARMKIGHVEAGLRSFDLMSPWPEEMNRSLVDRISDAMFAPTDLSRDNLLQENLPADRIIVTGNTIIDALLDFTKLLQSDVALRQRLEHKFSWLHPEKKTILVTGHRRESFGAGFEQICHALQSLSKREDIEIIYPVHLNPQVNGPVYRLLGNRPNLHLIGPQSYLDFVYLMTRSYLILTDSGGVQEEAPSLGKPVLVMRDITERPEAIAAGTVKLVGANAERIESSVAALLDDPNYYATFVHAHNPYGDGRASERIVAFLEASAIRN